MKRQLSMFSKIFNRVSAVFAKATPPPTVQHFNVPVSIVPMFKVRSAKRLVRRQIDGAWINPRRRSKAFRHCRTQCAGMR